MNFDLTAYRPHILAILRFYRASLPLSGPGESVELTMLGIGESNVMLLIVLANQPPLTMRIAYREDLADQYLPHEFHLLQQLPTGLGPHPFVLDMSRQFLPYPFALLSFVPGTPLVDYSAELLRAHARKIALMHQQESTGWTTREKLQSTDPFDFLQMFQRNVARLSSLYPDIFADATIQHLLPCLTEYFAAHNHLFTALTRFPLIHGDLCAPNILVHEGNVSYIDWEYSRYGDGALDFAQLAWDIANPPWQIQLTGQPLEAFFQTYLELRPDPTFFARYQVWIVNIKFIDAITHCHTARRSDAIQAFPGSYYQTVSQRLLNSLASQFLSTPPSDFPQADRVQ